LLLEASERKRDTVTCASPAVQCLTVERILAEVKRQLFQRLPAEKFFALLPHERENLVAQATSCIDESRRDKYRMWAERLDIGVTAAKRLHQEALTEKEVISIRESFLRCEMDKELAAASQPSCVGPFWEPVKAAVKAGPSDFPCWVSPPDSTPFLEFPGYPYNSLHMALGPGFAPPCPRSGH
jgi:hypothetical protein